MFEKRFQSFFQFVESIFLFHGDRRDARVRSEDETKECFANAVRLTDFPRRETNRKRNCNESVADRSYNLVQLDRADRLTRRDVSNRRERRNANSILQTIEENLAEVSLRREILPSSTKICPGLNQP